MLLEEQQIDQLKRVGRKLIVPESLDTIEYTHGLHRFPGKFIPQIPRYIFRTCLPDKGPVLDPFCGSGTTVVECAVAGRTCVGSDLDPLAVLIASAKTTPLTPEELENVAHALSLREIKRQGADWKPPVPNLTHWFTERAIEQLSAIKQTCLKLPLKQRNFSLAIFSSIIRRVSNADDQTQKTYVSHTKVKIPPEPFHLLPVFLNRAVPKMQQYAAATRHSPPPLVVRHDAREPLKGVEYRHVVTSPPYIDSIDYVYNQMLEYFWLLPELGLESHEAFRQFRKKPLGMRRDKPALPEPLRKSHSLRKAVDAIAAVSPKEADVVQTFFHEYALHLNAISSNQDRGGRYVTVVGRSFIRGVSVPTPEALAVLHEANCYRLIDQFVYSIQRHYMKFPRHSSSGKITEDHVLVFEKA